MGQTLMRELLIDIREYNPETVFINRQGVHHHTSNHAVCDVCIHCMTTNMYSIYPNSDNNNDNIYCSFRISRNSSAP